MNANALSSPTPNIPQTRTTTATIVSPGNVPQSQAGSTTLVSTVTEEGKRKCNLSHGDGIDFLFVFCFQL